MRVGGDISYGNDALAPAFIAQLLNCLGRSGLTPADRSRVAMPEPKPIDPAEAYFQ